MVETVMTDEPEVEDQIPVFWPDAGIAAMMNSLTFSTELQLSRFSYGSATTWRDTVLILPHASNVDFRAELDVDDIAALDASAFQRECFFQRFMSGYRALVCRAGSGSMQHVNSNIAQNCVKQFALENPMSRPDLVDYLQSVISEGRFELASTIIHYLNHRELLFYAKRGLLPRAICHIGHGLSTLTRK
jgi:hypothetical protein